MKTKEMYDAGKSAFIQNEDVNIQKLLKVD